MSLRYHVLDVFTETPLAGNPLAVVHEADGLDDEAMQAIAREFNLSETVFLMKPHKPVATARMRIFTPSRELPFAGHPTVGTAILMARLGWGEGEARGIVILEEEIGPVRVGVTLDNGRAFAEFDIPQMPRAVPGAPEADVAAGALGLIKSEVGFENHRPSRFDAGVDFAFVPVRGLDALRRCRLDPRAFERSGLGAVYAYCRETLSTANDFHARMFAPELGVAEDPATGSAAAAFAGVVMAYDRPTAGTHRYRIEQGHMMDRPSLVELELVVKGELSVARIGGCAVVVAEGRLTA